MTLPRLTKLEAINQLVKELHAKIGADVRAGEKRYDYHIIVSHYINRIEDVPQALPLLPRRCDTDVSKEIPALQHRDVAGLRGPVSLVRDEDEGG